jgi:protein-S-isoprenylcysteine O-methyltransferase Ste14
MANLELKVPPLAVWAVFAVAIAAAAHWLPSANLPLPGRQLIALVALLGGIAVFVAGGVEFKRAKTTVNPLTPEKTASIVSTGVYRLTRNPMYLGMAAALLGVALWWATPLDFYLLPHSACTSHGSRFSLRNAHSPPSLANSSSHTCPKYADGYEV